MTLTARDVWCLVRPYWVSDDRWRAYGLLATIVGLDALLTYVGVRQTYWQKNFFDALVERDLDAFWRQMLELVFIVAGIVGAGTARVWFEQALEMRWRHWLTTVYLDRWLGGTAYWRIESEGLVDNPDQRIADDLRLMASDTLRLSVGALHYAVDFFTFAAMIWGLSGALSFTLAGFDVHIPAYMLWAAVLYAVAGSVLIEWIGRGLVAVDYEQQRREADFRHLLVRVREHAAQVAMMRGEPAESAGLKQAFGAIRSNWRWVMGYTKRITAMNALYVQSSMVLPYLITGPRYFAGEITVGTVMQLNSLFNRVRGALSWFVYRYKDLALLRSVFQRLVEFERATGSQGQDPTGIRVSVGEGDTLQIRDLTLALPDGEPLGHVGHLQIAPGERVLVHGPSGSGKSLLLSAVAGLWRHGRGDIVLPQGKVMFVPQRSYLPSGTLHACLAYPAVEDSLAYPDAVAALSAVGLAGLVAELPRREHWMRRLSPGEQQRLAFARILLRKPDVLFLDETTSALDLDAEAMLYALLVERMPGCAVVSVAHRPSLGRFHTVTVAWNGTAARSAQAFSGPALDG
ncbi:ABC transporter ATP-binding protein/permease [Xanthomonas sp. AmX2]|uniref:ABC transporter ATP-binding protein/permease n=1 Tax=Xanthomonas sp. TaxID=29446 RepID=UPI00197ED34F|nr:ABC transporter ATP-binding protein/permease [Xanthomonas sp.]MBN6152190.1 ABC transporter ATP-binding protein/permease [Xanthomonas sp.]